MRRPPQRECITSLDGGRQLGLAVELAQEADAALFEAPANQQDILIYREAALSMSLHAALANNPDRDAP